MFYWFKTVMNNCAACASSTFSVWKSIFVGHAFLMGLCEMRVFAKASLSNLPHVQEKATEEKYYVSTSVAIFVVLQSLVSFCSGKSLTQAITNYSYSRDKLLQA